MKQEQFVLADKNSGRFATVLVSFGATFIDVEPFL